VRVAIQHRSRYLYPRPALLGPQVIRLRPADHTRALIERYKLVVAIDIRPINPSDFFIDDRVRQVPFRRGSSRATSCSSPTRG
jgi:hypothetical protein